MHPIFSDVVEVSLMRVFIAVDIDEGEIIENILMFEEKLKKSNAKLKLVEKENLHVTLKFIGEVDEKETDLIFDAVERGSKGFTKFEIEVVGAGVFPSLSRPRVVWVGIKGGADILSRLAASISRSLEQAGFRGDSKPFKPHITVARIKGYSGKISYLVKEFSDHIFGKMLVKDVRVKRSKLTPQGPIYTTLKSFELE